MEKKLFGQLWDNQDLEKVKTAAKKQDRSASYFIRLASKKEAEKVLTEDKTQ